VARFVLSEELKRTNQSAVPHWALSLEGMNAFLEDRKPDFQRFRMRNKKELDEYLDGCDKGLNAPPSMRGAG
jgi:hypothetical protein